MNEEAIRVVFWYNSVKMRTCAIMHDVHGSLEPMSCLVVDEIIYEGLVTFVVQSILLKMVKYESQVRFDSHYQVDIRHSCTNDVLPHRLADWCSPLRSSGE